MKTRSDDEEATNQRNFLIGLNAVFQPYSAGTCVHYQKGQHYSLRIVDCQESKVPSFWSSLAELDCELRYLLAESLARRIGWCHITHNYTVINPSRATGQFNQKNSSEFFTKKREYSEASGSITPWSETNKYQNASRLTLYPL